MRHWENKRFYEQPNEMDVVKAFWIVSPVMEDLGKTSWTSCVSKSCPLFIRTKLYNLKSSSSYVSSFILIKALKGRCLLFNFSIEETQGERGEAACSRSLSLNATELGCALQSSDTFSTEENPKWTHSCLQHIRIKCLQISNDRAIVQNISSTWDPVRGTDPLTQRHSREWGFHQYNSLGLLVRTSVRLREEREGGTHESWLLWEEHRARERSWEVSRNTWGAYKLQKWGTHRLGPHTSPSLFTRRVWRLQGGSSSMSTITGEAELSWGTGAPEMSGRFTCTRDEGREELPGASLRLFLNEST